jgi:hypothetical protein
MVWMTRVWSPVEVDIFSFVFHLQKRCVLYMVSYCTAVKWLNCIADHSYPPSAKVQNVEGFTFIHCNLSYKRSIPSSKASSPDSAIFCFLFKFQHLIFSLRSCSTCLHLHLLIPSIFPSCFKRKFLCKMRPIQLAFFCFAVCRMVLSSLSL